MKKFLFTLILSALTPAGLLHAQWVFSLTPTYHCYNPGGNQGIAKITIPTTTNGYSWTVQNPGTSTCAAVITPSAGTSGSIASIMYPCCGIYTVTSITLDQNSNPVASMSQTLQIHCQIQPTVTASNATICNNSSVSLTASGATGYTWQPGNFTGSFIVVSPNISTCYSVVAATGSCSASGSVCVTVANCTDLNDGKSRSELRVFFSSINDQIIFTAAEDNFVIYEIRDLLGKLLMTGEFRGNKQLDVSSLNKGVVLVRCQTSQGEIWQKVLLK